MPAPRPRLGLELYIPDFPFIESIRDAWLRDLLVIPTYQQKDLVVQYDELRSIQPSQLAMVDGKVVEIVRGVRVPWQLTFRGIEYLHLAGLYNHLEKIPEDHLARSLRGLMTWYQDGSEHPYFLLVNGSEEADLEFIAESWEWLPGNTGSWPFETVRNYSPPPGMPAGPVPVHTEWRKKFAGDPIWFHLGEDVVEDRFFVGGIEEQGLTRPGVDVVLNVSETPSRWLGTQSAGPLDRWDTKGEGTIGMQVDDLYQEGSWVAAHLQAGRRVLVHCTAGMNRSVSVCCAALILLEGLSAEQALARVHEHHPWGRPDASHWLHLRFLADNIQRLKS